MDHRARLYFSGISYSLGCHIVSGFHTTRLCQGFLIIETSSGTESYFLKPDYRTSFFEYPCLQSGSWRSWKLSNSVLVHWSLMHAPRRGFRLKPTSLLRPLSWIRLTHNRTRRAGTLQPICSLSLSVRQQCHSQSPHKVVSRFPDRSQ